MRGRWDDGLGIGRVDMWGSYVMEDGVSVADM